MCASSGVPPDKAEAQPGLITGRTPFGAKITDINGVEGELTNLANSPCQDQLCDGYQGYLEWTPSPYQVRQRALRSILATQRLDRCRGADVGAGLGGAQGGWSGEICIQACVSTGACPSAAGGPAHVCSQTCFKVTVPRCTWSLQNEDSFVEIAPRFQTNWLQVPPAPRCKCARKRLLFACLASVSTRVSCFCARGVTWAGADGSCGI